MVSIPDSERELRAGMSLEIEPHRGMLESQACDRQIKV